MEGRLVVRRSWRLVVFEVVTGRIRESQKKAKIGQNQKSELSIT